MPLQKSFSDQNHSAKQRAQWKRNKSFQGQQSTTSNPQSRPLREKPPIPVSTATKNKLSVFQFAGQPNDDGLPKQPSISLLQHDEKENQLVAGEQSAATADTDATQSQESALPSNSSKNVPSTPAPKLALPDLIGMGDIRREVQDVSPEDRIEWDQHSSNSSIAIAVRKRARSSSPISSPAARTPSRFNGKGELLHPQFDPGSELWGRYSLNESTQQGQPTPALANLMHATSPQVSKEKMIRRRSMPGFRRANSCGNQFPKRRRIGGPDDDVFTESTSLGPSKLSVLIERVHEGLTQPKQPRAEVEYSDYSFTSEELISDHDQRCAPGKGATQDRGVYDPQIQPETTKTPPRPSSSDGSDYGDFDDNDLDAITLLDAITQPPGQPPTVPNGASATKESQYAKHPGSFVTHDNDEFDDSDEDLFAADVEEIVAKFDNGRPVAETNALSINHNQKGTNVLEPSSEDEFGDGGFDDLDFEIAEAAATQSEHHTTSSLMPSTQKVRAIQRYLVTNILDSEYEASSGKIRQEKILLLQVENTTKTRTVHLRGNWIETPVAVKAFVHVIGNFESSGRCIIDDDANLLILHPDHLISSTVVADSFGCIRRAVLQDRIKATSDSNPAMVYGTLLHEIFQAAMVANRWDTEWLNDLIQDVATRHIEDLYTIKLQVPQAVDYLRSKMGEVQAWAEVFVSSQPKPEAIVKTGNGETATMCVSKLLDVEEHVWSPMYGLKGNIDATVQVTMKDGNGERTLTVPFEVKTGKNPSASHRAQTALYTLLLSDRYDIDIAYGILYYMETSETIRIPAIRRELIHMIMQRNELACFVRERHAQLPKMLKKESLCNRCYANVSCFIYHKLADDGTGETSGMKTKFDEVVKHLTPKHKAFFLKWDNLLTKEEKESLKFRRELWTMLSSEREKLGRCFSNVIIEPGSAHEDKDSPKINRYRYTMVKELSQDGFSFLESQITVGEPIVISDEQGHFALANGYVTHVRKNKISIAVDRRLHNSRIRQPGFDEHDNQLFSSIMEVGQEGSTADESEGNNMEEPTRYRLDKDEFSNGMASVRNNLIQVMADGPFGSREIRSLVVDLNAPRFKTQSTAYTLKDRENINVDQRRAIQKVMSAQDYALVLGMPGTGKTTTIAHIIRALVSQGKSVLLTSYTHTAVDNILLKLKDDEIPILRLGNIPKISTDVQEFVTLAATKKTSFEDIRSAWHDSPVVATTCLGINHPIFSERTFDYCIVDEASQITLPVCIGPIRMARTFILVGDHNQLPPLVQNEEARVGGLDISLFKHLSDMHPSSVVYLEHQYRMCEDVMALSNNLIYNGRLKCGSQIVADRQITIPHMDGLRNCHYSPSTLPRNAKTICPAPVRGRCWVRDLLDPDTKVSFINTDPLLPESREEAKGNRIVNPTEAALCVQLVESLLAVGVPASSIGVMTHYRSQLALLKHGLRGHTDVEMHTADRFQGRDKEVIILSLVRSNEAKSIGELLKDWRRINVAFTRAKTKLLVVGSRETLKGNGPKPDGSEEMVSRFIKLMEEKMWIYDLPPGALESHHFEDAAATQLTSSAPSRSAVTQPMLLKEKRTIQQRDVNGDKENNGELKRGRTENADHGKAKRQPGKKIAGNKPFKMPRMSVLTDIYNDALH